MWCNAVEPAASTFRPCTTWCHNPGGSNPYSCCCENLTSTCDVCRGSDFQNIPHSKHIYIFTDARKLTILVAFPAYVWQQIGHQSQQHHQFPTTLILEYLKVKLSGGKEICGLPKTTLNINSSRMMCIGENVPGSWASVQLLHPSSLMPF